jgi:phosphatidylinositol glycan class A protein
MQVLKFSLSTCDLCVGVSNATRDNLVLRASLDPSRVVAIPNAVEASSFQPDPDLRPKDRVNIVVISRLAYRKGVDLVAKVVPIACAKWPHVHFIIGGACARL